MQIESLLSESRTSWEPELSRFLAEGGDGSLVLFGAGMQGRLTLTELRSLGLGGNVRCFLDNNPANWGKSVMGIEVRPLSSLPADSGDTKILVAVGQPAPIMEQLRDAGFGSIAQVCDVTALRSGHYNRSVIEAHADELQSLHDALADDRSRDVLCHVIRHRLTGDPRDIDAVYDEDQYFDPGIIQLGADEVFVDGGAYDGDTITAFTKHCANGNFRAIFAFEPDSRNFVKLSAVAEAHPLSDRIHLFEAALHRERCSMVFDEGPEMSSHLSDGGTHVVQAISIDEALAGEAATFIKMDIEGAEREALAGAAETIRAAQPRLAIAAYHKPDDLWVLWRLIERLNPGYKFYLRHYSHLTFETILYAIPDRSASGGRR